MDPHPVASSVTTRLADAGAVADVRAVVVRRFERHGEVAVLDVHIEVAGTLVASLEHEAIVALP